MEINANEMRTRDTNSSDLLCLRPEDSFLLYKDLQNPACLREPQPRRARRHRRAIAIAQVAKEIHLPAAVGKELLVHFLRVEARHRTAIETERPRGQNEIA